MSLKAHGRRELGWLAAGMLSFVLSLPAMALDLDHEIQRQGGDAAQVLSTLGRDKGFVQSKSTSQVQLKLITKKKAHKRR